MAYLENYTSVLLGVFFIVTGVKNWVEHINVRILGLKSVPLRILFPIFCYVHSVKQCWQKHIPPKRGGDTLLSSKIAYPDWNEQAHLIKSKLDQTDQYFLSYGWFSRKKAKKAQRCSIGNCSKVFLGRFATFTEHTMDNCEPWLPHVWSCVPALNGKPGCILYSLTRPCITKMEKQKDVLLYKS